jgi:hypothetical protein
MSGSNGVGRITAEQLRSLKPLTAGDFYWGHKHADRLPNGEDDPQDLMFHAVHHAAVRAGMAKEEDLYGFLDRVEINVLGDMFGDELIEESGPLATTPTGSLPPSVTSGG